MLACLCWVGSSSKANSMKRKHSSRRESEREKGILRWCRSSRTAMQSSCLQRLALQAPKRTGSKPWRCWKRRPRRRGSTYQNKAGFPGVWAILVLPRFKKSPKRSFLGAYPYISQVFCDCAQVMVAYFHYMLIGICFLQSILIKLSIY